jgi:GNAT superfamily N-acetyltransferase
MHYRFAETDEEILACYPVMAELRPHIVKQEFVNQVRRQQQHGYWLAYLEEGEDIQAVVGFRIGESLAWGRYLYVDDLVSRAAVRSQGYGQELFTWVVDFAQSEGCAALHLDSGVQNFAAHRFYLRNNMIIASHHFRLALVGG